jgi:glucose/arabinose dehydrogenase
MLSLRATSIGLLLLLRILSAGPATAQPLGPTRPPPPTNGLTRMPLGEAFALPVVPLPSPVAAQVAPGFKVEIVTQNLIYPTSIAFDDNGVIYLAEAGYCYGDEIGPARVVMLTPQGVPMVVADHLEAPVAGLLWYQGRLYISHRGKISVLEGAMRVRDLVTGLPSLGDHSNTSMAVGPDGRIYFGVGTATNSGVVGLDNFRMGWLEKFPTFRDVPAHDVILSGQVFQTLDVLTALAAGQARIVQTAPFYPFGQASSRAAIVRGQLKSNGTILRMNPDGTGLEVFAWGLRNPLGLAFTGDGRLLVTDNGYDDRGSRPIANAPDCLWLARNGAWYGFPDYVASLPVTDPRFQPARGPAPTPLMQSHPEPEKPLMTFPPHTAPAKFAFSRSELFGRDQIYLAMFGDMLPDTGNAGQHVGFGVARIDLSTWQVTPFFRAAQSALGPRGQEYVSTAGPRRPIDARFSPDGQSLYVVDFGAVGSIDTAIGPKPRPYPGTGLLWRITPGRSPTTIPPTP